MALFLNRSFVPRSAVQNTIRRGIELHEKLHGPVTPEVRQKIERFVIKQAEILNMQNALKEDEFAETEKILYNGRRKSK